MYHKLGQIPKKKHTQFRKENGELYYEELFGNEGFSSDSSLIYHLHPPTQIKEVKGFKDINPSVVINNNLTSRKLKGNKIIETTTYHESKVPLLLNNDLIIGIGTPQQGASTNFYKNATGDELLFIHFGSGTLKSSLGNLSFTEGDYLIIPKGVIYKIEFETEENKFFYVDSSSVIKFPKKYLSAKGQFLEGSPICERDIRLPVQLETIDEKGSFTVLINKNNKLHEVVYATHPFDVIGWDGYCYPYAISIYDFEPITGRIHLPPMVHQIFEGHNFVICSFCPRLYDYHPKAIPAPYNHSNIDSDEVLYYVKGNFMSRDNVKCGDITLHPAGIPHGPHPGTAEKSIGKKGTDELAVMVDTFKPLKITEQAIHIEDPNYFKSWLTD